MTKKITCRQLGTRCIAFLLALITFLSAFTWLPLQASAASSTKKNIPSYIEFQAQEYASNFSMDSALSYASNLYDQLKADSKLQENIIAWETAHILESPSHLNETGMLYKGDFYKIAIFDMLDAANQNTVMSYIADNAYSNRDSAIYSLSNDLADEFELDVGKLNLINQKDWKDFLSKYNWKSFFGDDSILKEFTEECKNNLINEPVGAVDAIDIIFSAYNNLTDAVNAIASYKAISNMRIGVLQVLHAIAEDPNNDAALRNAAKACVPIFYESYENILTDVINGVKKYAGPAIKTVVSEALNLGWNTLVSMIPGANAFMFGLKGFRALMNAAFAFDERNEIYYKIESAVIIERAVKRIVETAKNSFIKNSNQETASFYMEAICFYQKAIIQGASYSVEYLENHIQPLGSQIWYLIIGKYDDMENAIATAKSIKEKMINDYSYMAQGVREKYIKEYSQDHNNVINKFNNQVKDSSVIAVEKTSYTYDADAAIDYAKKHCSNESDLKKSECTDGWLCAEFVANCLKSGGFKISDSTATVRASAQGEYMQKYGVKIDGKITSEAIKDDFASPLQKGDIVYVVYDNSVKNSGHVLLYSGEKDSNGNLLFYAHNSRKEKDTYKLTGKYLKAAKEIYAIHLESLGEATESMTAKYTLAWPISTKTVSIGKVSSKFGPRVAPTAGASTLHRGIDIAVKSGTSVYSSADGVVTAVGYNEYRGNYVVIYHESINLSTLYQHLKSYSVKKGDKVSGGQEIAKSGNTGTSTGAHLHYGVMVGKATKTAHDQAQYKMAIDPLSKDIQYVDYTGFVSKDYKISSLKCTDTTNNFAEINVSLNDVATVQKWTYFLSKSKSQVENVDGTKGSTHKSVTGMDCVRILDYTSDPQEQKTANFTIGKMAKQPLEPNTTYYYKVTVKIGSNWYESKVGSFTTANVLPGAPSVRVTWSSEKIGIGDQAQLLWDAVDNAESYNIIIKNSDGDVVQTKSNVTGTTCVIDGLDEAGTYTASIEAVNSAGITAGMAATFTVMPNVTVTFYDPIGEKVIDTRIVAYGHSASAPKNPQQEGHTFAKWDKDFDKVTENITVNAVYDVNSYTVKFIDSFTNTVIGTPQTVKYGSNATAPTEAEIDNIPEGYALSAWDKSYNNVKSDLTVYAVYKWTDTDNTATITINSVKRNTTKKGYDVSVTVSNKVAEVSTGRVIYVLKSEGGAILATVESSAFAIDHLSNKTIADTIKCSALASKIEVYVVNGYESLGQISKVAYQNIDNSTASEWSEWITYTGDCPISSGNGVTVETQTLSNTTPDKKYYRYKILSTTTSYDTSMSGWTQNGYSLVKADSGSITYVSAWHSGFSKSNSLYTKYNKTPLSAYENSTQKVVIDSNKVVGYVYWHWCRGENKGAINRKIGWTKSDEFDTFHAFFSTEKLDYCYNPSGKKVSGANAYGYANESCCTDTYWWNGAVSGKDSVITVKEQTYTQYNKLYNYYKYSGYSDWIEYSGNVPVSKGQSAGTNETYQNIETKTVTGTTITTYQYRYKTTGAAPTITEPNIPSNQIYTLSGTVGSQFAGKSATVWVYKFDQPSNENIQYIGTTTVGSDGSIKILDAKLMSAPTVESGDYTVVASVAGQVKSIKIGTIEAPKPQYTVTFYDFDGETVLSQQTVTSGESAVLPAESLLNMPDGYRFTNWSQSVVNVRSNLSITPEYETESYVVAFVNWEKHTVELKEFLYGAELAANKAPDGKDGYITEWVIQVDGEHLTINEFHEAGYTVSGNMVVETRSTPEKYTVTIVDADPQNIIDGNKIVTDGIESDDIATEYIVENGDYIDFSSVQTSIEESPDYIFTGWINAYTGAVINETKVDDNLLIYPSYVFAETTDVPEADIGTGEYGEEITVTLECTTIGATIWYTTDNSDPTISETAKEYTEPITLSESCVLRYYASSLGKNDSCVDQELYAINIGETAAYHIVTIWSDILTESGSEPSRGLVEHGTLLPESLFNSISGCEFEGMFYDSEYSTAFDITSQPITQSIDLCAKYSYKKYAVEYREYDGTVVSTQIVEYSKSAVVPQALGREGYVFVGWDRDCEYITADTVINAMYIPVSEYATVDVDIKNVYIELHGNTQLTAIVESNSDLVYDIIWESLDPSIAMIDQNGNVNAISVGTTTVTVMLPYTGVKATATVTVTEPLKINSSASIGFDSKGYLRGVTLGANTVAQIRSCFDNQNLVFRNAQGKTLVEDELVSTGTVIQFCAGDEVISETIVIVGGDFNCDGIVNNKDIVLINQFLVGERIANDVQILAIDVNGDGEVTERDCTVLSNYLVNKESLN